MIVDTSTYPFICISPNSSPYELLPHLYKRLSQKFALLSDSVPSEKPNVKNLAIYGPDKDRVMKVRRRSTRLIPTGQKDWLSLTFVVFHPNRIQVFLLNCVNNNWADGSTIINLSPFSTLTGSKFPWSIASISTELVDWLSLTITCFPNRIQISLLNGVIMNRTTYGWLHPRGKTSFSCPVSPTKPNTARPTKTTQHCRRSSTRAKFNLVAR